MFGALMGGDGGGYLFRVSVSSESRAGNCCGVSVAVDRSQPAVITLGFRPGPSTGWERAVVCTESERERAIGLRVLLPMVRDQCGCAVLSAVEVHIRDWLDWGDAHE